LDIDLSKWDLRQNWDPANDSAAAKGIQFGLRGAGNDAQVGFDTQGTTGFRAFATGTGAAFSGLRSYRTEPGQLRQTTGMAEPSRTLFLELD
jgi:hypothetical protein